LGISVVPVEVGAPLAARNGIKIIALSDSWAQRRFIVCFRSFEGLQAPAQRLVDHLVERAAQAA
jgi:DNA-binding transcriptional LysR family regulator